MMRDAAVLKAWSTMLEMRYLQHVSVREAGGIPRRTTYVQYISLSVMALTPLL